MSKVLPTLPFLATFFTRVLAFLAFSRKAQRDFTAFSWKTCSVVESWLQFDFDMGQFDVEPRLPSHSRVRIVTSKSSFLNPPSTRQTMWLNKTKPLEQNLTHESHTSPNPALTPLPQLPQPSLEFVILSTDD